MDCRIRNVVVDEENIKFELIRPKECTFSFKIGSVKRLKGFISRYQLSKEQKGYLVSVEGKGIVEITSKNEIEFENDIISDRMINFEEHLYRVRAR